MLTIVNERLCLISCLFSQLTEVTAVYSYLLKIVASQKINLENL